MIFEICLIGAIICCLIGALICCAERMYMYKDQLLFRNTISDYWCNAWKESLAAKSEATEEVVKLMLEVAKLVAEVDRLKKELLK